MFINETIFIYIHISFPVIKHSLLLKERENPSFLGHHINKIQGCTLSCGG